MGQGSEGYEGDTDHGHGVARLHWGQQPRHVRHERHGKLKHLEENVILPWSANALGSSLPSIV